MVGSGGRSGTGGTTTPQTTSAGGTGGIRSTTEAKDAGVRDTGVLDAGVTRPSTPETVKVPTFPDRTCPVAAGANTAAVNKAIADCNAAGGGVVTFAAGTYSLGSLHLMSNVKLDLRGATLRNTGTDPAEPYSTPVHCSDEGHRHWHNAFLWGENLTRVAVVGPGTLTSTGLDFDAEKMIALKGSSELLFDNFKMSNTGHFAFLLTGCTDITMTNLTINPSRDGVDLMQCSNVYASKLTITGGGDDAFALKSDCEMGKRMVSDNITVTDSTFSSTNCNALQIGSETWGDFQNISWSNIKVLRGGKSGIGIQSNDGAVIRNMSYDNITMANVSFPIFMSVTSILRASTKTPGHMENIRFSNITATDIIAGNNASAQQTAIVLSGQTGNFLKNIVLDRVTVDFPGGGKTSGDPPEGSTLTGATSYNPRYMNPLPAYGLFGRHIQGLELRKVTFTHAQVDARPALVGRDISGLLLDTFKADNAVGSLIELETTKNLTITGSPPIADTSLPSVDKKSF